MKKLVKTKTSFKSFEYVPNDQFEYRTSFIKTNQSA
jgi:hypothetical protein